MRYWGCWAEIQQLRGVLTLRRNTCKGATQASSGLLSVTQIADGTCIKVRPWSRFEFSKDRASHGFADLLSS